MSTLKVDTIRPVTTDASLTLQGDSSGSGVTGAKVFGDGSLGADSITDLAGTGAPDFPNGLTTDDALAASAPSATHTLNRNTTDGDILEFSKDSTAVGSVGSATGRLFIADANNASGIKLYGSGIHACGTGGTAKDNANDLGNAAARWQDIYATNAIIQTSDINEKQDVDSVSIAEQRVAIKAKGLLRKFRWKSAVEKKNDLARIHFGIIAQDLQAAFETEGLDAGRYGMFIKTAWWESEETYTDVDGVEKTRINIHTIEEEAPSGAVKKERMGVRYSELFAFIISAI